MSTLTECRSCRRLTANLDRLRAIHPDWHNKPVPSIGPADAPLLILGLAPGRAGANRTGIPFVGDKSSQWLCDRLQSAGCLDASGRPLNVRISNAVKCLPPGNRPTIREIKRCVKKWTATEFAQPNVVLALGSIAHDAVLRAHDLPLSQHRFGHGKKHQLHGIALFDSYHPSPLNTQTGRLTVADFDRVLNSAISLASDIERSSKTE